MPEATLKSFSLDGLAPQELETRRRTIVSDLTTKYKGYDDPDVPLDLLAELTAVTSALRRKTAGPPKVSKLQKGKKASIDDL